MVDHPISWHSRNTVTGDPSGIHGLGIFAAKAVAAGEVVAVKGGHIITENTRRALKSVIGDGELPITADLYVAPISASERSTSMLFFNHSCEPNCGFLGNIVVVAMRDIRPDEELTVDYAMCWTHSLRLRCNCQTGSCRHIIRGRDWRRPDLQMTYTGYFSSYVQVLINEQHRSDVTTVDASVAPSNRHLAA